MHPVRTASLALDLALVVILFVVVVFAAAYRPVPEQTDTNYRPDVVTDEVGPVSGGNAPR